MVLEKIDTLWVTIFFIMCLFVVITSALIMGYSQINVVSAAQSRATCRDNKDVSDSCPHVMKKENVTRLYEAGFNMLITSVIFTCLCIAVYVSKFNAGEFD
jgi:hypothetical protein